LQLWQGSFQFLLIFLASDRFSWGGRAGPTGLWDPILFLIPPWKSRIASTNPYVIAGRRLLPVAKTNSPPADDGKGPFS